MSGDIGWANVRLRVGDLKPWEHNPRQITKAQARRLLESWRRYGQVHLVVVGPDNEVYDGHQRLSALLAVYGPGCEIEARRASRALTDNERRRLTVYLHAGAVGTWNWDALSAWNAENLVEWGMDAETMNAWRTDTIALSEMLSASHENFEPEPDPSSAFLDKPKTAVCPKCGYEFET